MPYVQPQLRIFQEFEAALTGGLTPLYSCIIGPQFGIHSGDDCGSLGAYDRTASTTYSWPDKTAGSTVEQDTASVTMNDAVLKYYAGAGFAVPAGTPAGSNKIRAAGLVLRSENGYTRSAIFGTRDVAVDDRVSVTWGAHTVNTRVAGFEADIVNTIGAATAATSNQTGTPAVAPTVDSQTIADDTLLAVAGGTYDGLAEGVVSESYTVTVTKAGGTGIAEATIVSGSGTDDVSLVVVNYTSTDIGTRGVTCSITNTGSSSSSHSSSSPSESSQTMSQSSASFSDSSASDSHSSASSEPVYRDLQVGDTWEISAQQAFVVPTPVSGGSYAGPADTRYIVRIVTGGVIGVDAVVYNVTTSNGIDVQSDTIVNAAGDIIIGNYGVVMTLAAGAQYAGHDAWYIDVLDSNAGAVRTILLADKLVDGASQAAVGDPLTTVLGLVSSVTLPQVYLTTTATTIRILAGAKVTTTDLGVAQQFDILAADMCVNYRELLIDNATSINAISSVTDVSSTIGPVITRNPLAKGVYSALQNSNGTTVYYVAVATDDVAGYTDALDLLSTNQDVYSLVVLNKTTAVRNLVEAHVDEQSSENFNNWRIAWFNSNVSRDEAIYTEDMYGDELEATVTDPMGGSNYVLVTCAGGLFVTNNTRPGDILRINYRPFAGEMIYDTAIIDTVTEEELTLVAPLATGYPVAVKVEVYRTRTLTQYATAIGNDAGAIKNRRMYYIWPDEISDGTDVVSGIYLCAGLAGLRSGVAPHAPLTNVQISGFYNPTRTLMFNATQLNTMAGNGVWIVTQDLSGTVYTRHQVSTDNTDINRREQTITTNLDSISRQYREGFSDLVGRGNVSDDMINIIRTRVHSISGSIQGLDYPLSLGPQLQGYTIKTLEIDPVLRDRIRLTVTPVLPYPLNNLDITMLIA